MMYISVNLGRDLTYVSNVIIERTILKPHLNWYMTHVPRVDDLPVYVSTRTGAIFYFPTDELAADFRDAFPSTTVFNF